MTTPALPPTEQLLAFKTVVDCESFTAAAAALNITQSAVSHQIEKLERRLGLRLLNRRARTLSLTHVGEALYNGIAAPLEMLIEAFRQNRSNPGRARLRIQVEPLFASAWLSPRLQQFLDRFPALQLEQIRTFTSAFADQFDLGIKWGKGLWPKCQAERLMTVDYTPVCSPTLLEGALALRTPQDLTSQTLIHDRRYSEWQRWFTAAGLDGRRARRGHLADDTNIVIEMARAGRGIALANPLLLQRELSQGALILPFPTIRLVVEEAYYLVVRKDATLSPAAEAFVVWLREQVRVGSVGLEPGFKSPSKSPRARSRKSR